MNTSYSNLIHRALRNCSIETFIFALLNSMYYIDVIFTNFFLVRIGTFVCMERMCSRSLSPVCGWFCCCCPGWLYFDVNLKYIKNFDHTAMGMGKMMK